MATLEWPGNTMSSSGYLLLLFWQYLPIVWSFPPFCRLFFREKIWSINQGRSPFQGATTKNVGMFPRGSTSAEWRSLCRWLGDSFKAPPLLTTLEEGTLLEVVVVYCTSTRVVFYCQSRISGLKSTVNSFHQMGPCLHLEVLDEVSESRREPISPLQQGDTTIVEGIRLINGLVSIPLFAASVCGNYCSILVVLVHKKCPFPILGKQTVCLPPSFIELWLFVRPKKVTLDWTGKKGDLCPVRVRQWCRMRRLITEWCRDWVLNLVVGRFQGLLLVLLVVHTT